LLGKKSESIGIPPVSLHEPAATVNIRPRPFLLSAAGENVAKPDAAALPPSVRPAKAMLAATKRPEKLHKPQARTGRSGSRTSKVSRLLLQGVACVSITDGHKVRQE